MIDEKTDDLLIARMKEMIQKGVDEAVESRIIELLRDDPAFWERVRVEAAKGHLTLQDAHGRSIKERSIEK